jgi:FkbM family methyltransferase
MGFAQAPQHARSICSSILARASAVAPKPCGAEMSESERRQPSRGDAENSLFRRALNRIGPHLVRALIRHVPPRGRGMRLAQAWSRVSSPPLTHVVSREPSGMRLRCDLRDALARVVFYRGCVDRDLEGWLSAWLRPGDTYVDVGAHIGFYVSLALRAIGPSGRVIAFEPLAENFDKLSASVREVADRYPNVELHRVAVGSVAGNATLFAPADEWEHQSYRASLVAAGSRAPSGDVPVVSLDDALGRLSCRLLKIDVEGYEIEVLRGAASFLSDGLPEAIVIELNPPALEAAGRSTAELVALLSGYGYARHAAVAGGRLGPADGADVVGEFADAVFLRPAR